MSRNVFCHKLQQELPGLDRPPYPGDLGQKIYDAISKPAWEMWLNHQTMLINEYRLSSLDSKAREMLRTEMMNFLFNTTTTENHHS